MSNLAAERGILLGSRHADGGIRPKIAKDELLQRGLLLVIIAYLFFALLVPLALVGIKSVQVFSFPLNRISIEFKQNGNWSERRSLASWAEQSGFNLNADIKPGERSRLDVASVIPRKERRDVEAFRLRDNDPKGGLLIVNGTTTVAGIPVDVAYQDFGKVQLKPAMSYGFENFKYYFETPALRQSILNSLFIALLVSAIVTPIAFLFAYGLARTHMRGKSTFKLIASLPVLVPSLLPGIGLVYLFGKQGILTPLLFGASIYGPLGIVLASIFFTLPHALMIMSVTLSTSDQRLYEAADVLGASPWRVFYTVTLPAARYGLVSAFFVVFTLVVTDFGVPKVIGGGYQMLALDIYKQVIGQQNFQMGAVVSLVLLLPAILAFVVDRLVSRKQVSVLTARSVPYTPKDNKQRDAMFFTLCTFISLFVLAIIIMCQIAALAKYWPYNLSLGLQHYDFNRMDGGGWRSYTNSLMLAFMTASIGAVLIFFGAYLVEKTRNFKGPRLALQIIAMVPMAVPGMVLGLAYIFFFNNPENPLNALYGTMAILVICTISHLYTVPHLTAVATLKQMDAEFEAVSMSLKQPFWRTFTRVSIPVCFPAMAEIWIYLFVNAMTTVSAVVFLYSATTTLSSIAVLNMDDAGDIAPAAAMGMMIFYTNVGVRLLHGWLTGRIITNHQKWRRR